jgi:hypothetical protein
MSQSLRIERNGREKRVGAPGSALLTKWPCHQSIYASAESEEFQTNIVIASLEAG